MKNIGILDPIDKRSVKEKVRDVFNANPNVWLTKSNIMFQAEIKEGDKGFYSFDRRQRELKEEGMSIESRVKTGSTWEYRKVVPIVEVEPKQLSLLGTGV